MAGGSSNNGKMDEGRRQYNKGYNGKYIFFESEGGTISRNFTSMPKIIKVEILTHVHPSVRFLRLTKSSFANRSNSILPLAGRLKQFLPSWKKLRKDLTFIKGYIIPNRNQEKLIGNEINKLLEKKASSHICHQKGDFSAECFW